MRIVFFCLFSLFITACSTQQLPITKASHERAAQLQQHNKSLTSWDMTASTSLTTDKAIYSMTVFWHQLNDHYKLRFDAPFSTGVLKVKGHNGFAELTVENKKTIQGTKPEDLISEATQFNIPVTGLTQWIRGITHQSSAHKLSISANGDTKTISQDGWLIEYDNWEKFMINQQAYRLPSSIILSQESLIIRINPSTWVKAKPATSNPIFSDLDFN